MGCWPNEANGSNCSPLAPVLRGEGSGVRGLGRGSFVTPNPSPPKRGRGEIITCRSPKQFLPVGGNVRAEILQRARKPFMSIYFRLPT